MMFSNIGARPITSPEFHPIYAKAEQYELPILIHPAPPLMADVMKKLKLPSHFLADCYTSQALPKYVACPPFRDGKNFTDVSYRLASPQRAQKFPRVASFRIEISSGSSAASFFSRVFSFSSSLRRLAWSIVIPP